jgi:3-hydroxyacyl-[acyl-carrier-protein] dehydratase
LKLINVLFEVIENRKDESGFITKIKLNPAHLVYTGHFPGHPVTPGVVQLQIVHELSEIHFQKNLGLVTIEQCKFLKIINPLENSLIVISVFYSIKGRQLHFNARGEAGTDIFFKLNGIYQFI